MVRLWESRVEVVAGARANSKVNFGCEPAGGHYI